MAPLLTRVPYEAAYARDVVAWPRDARELDMLTSQHDGRLTQEMLRAWSEAEDGSAFVFLEGGRPCAYAELWEEEGEAEIARILVAPGARRRRVARAVVASLVEEAQARGLGRIWLRVVPENVAAIDCYAGAGFVRTSEEREAEFNEGQPHDYVWMSYAGG